MAELYAVADFCLIPMGTGTSVGEYIAECQRVLERSGLKYELHGYGTNVEGPFDAVTSALKACHEAVHAMGAPRISTDLRIGTRVDKPPPPKPEIISSSSSSLPSASASAAAPGAAEGREGEPEGEGEGGGEGGGWEKGLGENERKRESVRRILARDKAKEGESKV